jgi:hypothetical protein
MARRSLLSRIHNPRNRRCGCDADCWCRRTALGRAVKWWFPGRLFGLHHKGPWRSAEWKREHDVPI